MDALGAHLLVGDLKDLQASLLQLGNLGADRLGVLLGLIRGKEGADVLDLLLNLSNLQGCKGSGEDEGADDNMNKRARTSSFSSWALNSEMFFSVSWMAASAALVASMASLRLASSASYLRASSTI